MALTDPLRQILAGCASAVIFLTLYFGLTLVWWAAFGLALVSYLALLLLLPRKPLDDEIVLSGTTTQADLSEAARIMDNAAYRLLNAVLRIPEEERGTVEAIIDHVRSIRQQVSIDVEDYRRARRFITSYLGNMVDAVESYADLSEKSRGQHSERLAPLAERINSFVPALQKIDAACLENDFLALESQMEALDFQMKRG
ncbi:5-bromo-4-chloroindolyl phosphate hydrolysis family protein [Actibacterium sp. 188UL27-1]|uniref:5-bromo-4-chloroindolyl phosphate hydrolysis family protein n=1 Tax=Actibacterium sp. 188UL27-1 TaxID=2786961 RepID=UPI0019599CB1|nr:5-bromo-4-chloroindolyl phosphate hydrolysis family protein [Actibacterium sp. 188UL27-1]MBM7069726.1 5-bromo-4-chloroindolyl phosphate hydrolysis family protein [Actibacterium sp. 188UL27-1]